MNEERVLDKVRKLLDRANHPNTPEAERDSCLAMADKMMAKHAIDAAMLDAAKDPNERRKPVTRQMNAWQGGYAYRNQFTTMLGEIARTAGVRAAVTWDGNTTLVGMSDDVDYVELLWTSAYFAFLSKIDPKWSNDLSFEHNVYNFKLAGLPWKRIAKEANANNCYVEWPDGGRLIRAYKRHCKILGEEPTNHTQRHDAYRQSFIDGFVDRLCLRLSEMRMDRNAAAEEGGALVLLRDVKADVDAAYYQVFPDQTPEAKQARADANIAKYEAEAAAKEEARQEMLSRMTDKQREAFFAKEERDRRRRAAADERYWASEEARRYDSDGRRAGRAAANSVDLGRTGGSMANNVAGEL